MPTLHVILYLIKPTYLGSIFVSLGVAIADIILDCREAMTIGILSGHRQVAPFGLAGGEPGAVGRNSPNE